MEPAEMLIHSIPERERAFGSSVSILCSMVVATCAVDLLGWWFHHPSLVSLFSGQATMKPNTAVTLILLAGAVVGRQADRRWRLCTDCLCCLAILVTAATLLEYVSDRNLRIDELLATVPPDSFGDPAGRMSPGTALDGLLTGVGLLALDAAPWVGGTCAALGGLVSLSALVGYLFDAGPLFGVPLLRSMAVRTAICFFAVQFCSFAIRPWREPIRSLLRSAKHHRAGVWFVLGTCTLPLLLGWPVAVLLRHRVFEPTFSFAVLVVALIAVQALLVWRNSRSLAQVENKRDEIERQRLSLARENERQYTEMVASEQRAAQSEAQYRLITDALPTLVCYLDRELRYVRMNRTYEEWFDLSAAEMEGQPMDAIPGSLAEKLRSHLPAALTGAPQTFEVVVETRRGARTLVASQIPDVDAGGSVRGVIVQAEDVTSRRQAEAALRQTEKLAAVGKLASSIAHEINNPLEAVTNLLFLATTSTSMEEVQHFLGLAEQELRRVSVIANQTLRFHKQATRPVMVRAGELLDTVLAVYQGRLHNGRICLEQRHRPAAPVCCLDGEIRQVLNNLVGNAIDAMGGEGGRLLLRSRPATDWQTGRCGLVLTVADTGSGMSGTTLANLFEAFYTTKGVSGTGLGLWVSQEIVQRHQGRLRVRSSQRAPQQGTAFRLFLPYVDPETAARELARTT